jgi:Inverse autotransporter, beta-domain
MNKSLGISILGGLLTFYSLNGEEKNEAAQASSQTWIEEQGPRSCSINARHIEGGGIGYNQGYTSLEGFVSYRKCNIIPFLDLRAHVTNDGKFDANAGVGFRYLSGCRSYGFNAYYDYRTTSHHHYNQVGIGLETLGENWDLLVNGYIPVGDRKSSYYDQCCSRSVCKGEPAFSHFSGHNIILGSDLCISEFEKKKIQFSMAGIDALVRFPFWKGDESFLSGAIGPYYYNGYYDKYAVGGKLRISFDWREYVGLRLYASYDNLFHTRVQGEIVLSCPLGPKKEKRNCPHFFNHKLVEEVERAEIIVVDSHKIKKVRTQKCTQNDVAINPVTGNPYFVWFVNNMSHSAGTFESPFDTLLAAQNASSSNDIIYVYPGNGTSIGMNEGFTFQDEQKFFGAGIDQTLLTTTGLITIPAQASGMPLVTNDLLSVFLMANNNELSGIHIKTDDALVPGILCSDITHAMIHDNIIDGSSIIDGDQFSALLALDESGGNINVQNNTFLIGNEALNLQLFAVHFFSTQSNANYFIDGNHFLGPISTGNGSAGIEFGGLDPIGDFEKITISNNEFFGLGWGPMSTNQKGHAIAGYGFTGKGDLIIDHNIFSHVGGNQNVTMDFFQESNLTGTITNNAWIDSLRTNISSFQQYLDSNSEACIKLVGNSSDIVSPTAPYHIYNFSGGNLTVQISDNVGEVQIDGSYTSGTCP